MYGVDLLVWLITLMDDPEVHVKYSRHMSGARPRAGALSSPASRQRPRRKGLIHVAEVAERPLRWIHYVELAVFRLAYGFFASLPRGVALRLGAGVGELFYAVDASDRRVALRNLAIAFPERSDAERRAILRRSCRNLGRMAAEFCQLQLLTPESVERFVQIGDRICWERMMTAARERGVVVLTGHFGNWELLACAHALIGYPVTFVHRPMHNRLFDDAITVVRERPGTRLLKKKAAAKEALRALHRHEIVAIPADQNQTRRFGVFVDFFGVPAATTPGPARLAMLTGAAVYPVFLVRDGETARHRIVVLPEVEMVRTGDRQADIITNTRRCNAVIEQMLREHPDHWIWFHRRWKTRPEGEPSFY